VSAFVPALQDPPLTRVLVELHSPVLPLVWRRLSEQDARRELLARAL